MNSPKSVYVCDSCGADFVKWFGQCPSCHEWNTLKRFSVGDEGASSSSKGASSGVDLTKSERAELSSAAQKFASGITEVDRVIGEGFFPGSVVLFGGQPGIGKSTLCMQVFLSIKDAMYFSGEESYAQIASRAERLDDKAFSSRKDRLFASQSLEDILSTITTHRPSLAIIDSIQMVRWGDDSSANALRLNAEKIIHTAKSVGTTILLIGHVTKNDELAGPKMLEHLVDGVLYLEGEKNTQIRILRATKNRYGTTDEVGVFAMEGSGLQVVGNPSEFFLAERPEHATGSVITVVREGARNFLLEVQALTVKTNFGLPKRTSHGVDLAKLHLLLAVIAKYTRLGCDEYDAYLNIIGGMKVRDPSLDLAFVAAIMSSRMEKSLPPDTIVLGEVGMSGEVRSVPNLASRLSEAAKLGFKRAVIPASQCDALGADIKKLSISLVPVRMVTELLGVF